MEERSAPQELDSLIDEIELRCDPEIGCAANRSFLRSCLLLIQKHLPEIALPTLDLLNAPSSDALKAQALSTRLGQAVASYDELSGDQSPAAGAAMTALYAEINPEQRDISQYLRDFVNLVNGIDPQYDNCIQLLREHFRSYLT